MRLALLTAVLLSVTLPAEAQRRALTARASDTTVRAADWQRAGGVPVVQVAHGSGRASSHRIAEPIRLQRGAALTDRQRARLLVADAPTPAGGAGQIAAPPPAVLQHLRLTPRTPFHGLGHLRLAGPMVVDAEADYAYIQVLLTPGTLPSIRVTAELEAGERYLLDLHIDATTSLTFELEGGGAEISYEVGTQDEHLLLIVEPQSDGDYEFTLTAPYDGGPSAFRFYAAEVSRLD